MKTSKHLTAGAMRRLAIRAERRASAVWINGRAASERVAAEIRAESVVIHPAPMPEPWRLFFSASELTGVSR